MRIQLLIGVLLFTTTSAFAAVDSIEKSYEGVTLHFGPQTLSLQFYSSRVLHVHRFTQPTTQPSLTVTAHTAVAHWEERDTPDAIVLTSPNFQASVNRSTGLVSFLTPTTKPVMRELAPSAEDLPHPVQQDFSLTSSEAIYGLGQHQAGLMSYRSSTVHLQQANMDVAVPFLLSSAGYGILWDNPSITNVRVATPTLLDRTSFTSEAGDVDYYFITGPEPDDIVAAYRTLTGPAPLMARWTWGFWQSRERYKTQEELLNVAAHYRQMKVPIDGLVQDWQYWPKDQWGSHEFDLQRYPDPKGMIDQLHKDHYHLIISVWPKFHPDTANAHALDAIGALYPPTFINGYFKDRARWYDAFNLAGRQLYWSQIWQHLGTIGIDGWWLDASEPELGNNWGELRNLPTALGPGSRVYNAYPLLHTSAVYDGQRGAEPAKRVFILTRSAYAGQQRNAAVSWSGDIRGNWDVFRRQIPAGLNFCASGIPYWNTDIGGFFGGKPSDPDYRELFLRWFQFGAFCPMFRVHGTGPGKEMWQFDEPAQQILAKYDRLRYRLLPYIYSISWKVTHDGYTMMRPLAFDFRTDRNALDIPDEYMFGPALLVAPVTQPHATARSVYLPAGTAWYDFWTNQRYEGGTVVVANAPLDTLPLFVRAGSILPLGPDVQYADEQPNAPLALQLYPGADGSFTLYDDAGDSYAYEQDQHATIPLIYTDSTHTLSVARRSGSYLNMPPARAFSVRLVPNSAAQSLNYSGESISMSAESISMPVAP